MSDESTDESTHNNIPSRGFWLSGFLILMMLANPLTAYTYLLNPEPILQGFPEMNQRILYVLAAVAILNMVFAIAIWCWKKWGVFGFYGSAVFAFFVNMYAGLGVKSSMIGLIAILIVYLLTRSRWHRFT